MPTVCVNPQLKTPKINKVHHLQFNPCYFQQNSTSKMSKHIQSLLIAD